MKWLHTHYWLSYSEYLNSGFYIYLPCVFHLKINHNQVGKCVTSSMIKFKDAIAEEKMNQLFTTITLWKKILVVLQ